MDFLGEQKGFWPVVYDCFQGPRYKFLHEGAIMGKPVEEQSEPRP